MKLAQIKYTQRKRGWIGIDIGTSTVKVAQIVRYKRGWRIAASAVVPRQQAWQDEFNMGEQAGSSLNELQAARSLQQGYRGRSVAATMPMTLCDVHRVDRDLSKEPNAQQILRKTIETAIQQSAEHLQCDYWSAPAIESKPAWSQALTVSRTWTDQLCEDIAQAGWKCETIDGLPLTMARAVGMVHPETSTQPVAALDWGSSRATLCIIEQGQPSYVRCLKGCGLRNILNALVENLQVTDLEAQQLLEDYGLSPQSSEETDEITQLIQEIISEPLSQIVEEIKRSCSHFQYVRRSPGPKNLYLLGGGAMIKSLGTHLTGQLEIETRSWQLPALGQTEATKNSHADCLFASAIALSALAWRAS